MKKDEKRKVGRPRKAPVEGERHPVTFRLTAEVKQSLEKAADQSGRSLSQEGEMRLEQSFRDDTALGGGATAMLFRGLAGVVWVVEKHFGKSWSEDRFAAAAVEAALVNSARAIVEAVTKDEIDVLTFRDRLDHPEALDPATIALVEEREKGMEAARDIGRNLAIGVVRPNSATAGK